MNNINFYKYLNKILFLNFKNKPRKKGWAPSRLATLKRISLFACLLLIGGFSLQGQTLKAYEEEAQKAFQAEQYSVALAYYEKALEIEPDKIENLYQVAETARLFHAYQMAEKYYLRVAAHEEWEKYPYIDFVLADMKKRLGKYEEAADLFERFADNASLDVIDQKDVFEARQQVRACRNAILIVEDSLDYYAFDSLPNINTEDSEYAGYASEEVLYYSALRFNTDLDRYEPEKAKAKLYRSVNGSEGDRITFDEADKHLANAALSGDGNRIYYTECEYIRIGNYRCDLFYRDKMEDETWGAAVRLPDNINQIGYHTTQPSIGVDANGTELLFFSSNRPNGRGNMDIWCSIVKSGGLFSSPFNLRNLNTNKDDITPFYHSPSHTLYFSSEGHGGIGGFDVFKSKQDGSRYATPQNMGYPLNSSYNDTHYSVLPNGRIAYLSTNRSGVTYVEDQPNFATCCPDILKVDIEIKVDLIASTYNKLSGEALPTASVRLIDMETGEEIEVNEQKEHQHFYGLTLDKDYMLIGYQSQYTSDTVIFDTKNIFETTTIEKDLFLTPGIDLKALTFDEISREPLYGVEIQIIDLPDTLLLKETKAAAHEYYSAINFEKEYMIVASKEGYTSDTVRFNTIGLKKEPQSITKELYLRPPSLRLPIVLYFDNDYPDPRSRATISSKAYGQTFDAYYAKKDRFIREYVGKSSGDKEAARERMIEFFEEDVRGGYEQLEAFSSTLLEYLEKGNSLEISIQGFASPRAKSDYNVFLTQRRISSVRKQFANYKGGVFLPYIESGSLRIQELPRGETSAPKDIPDETIDEIDSIYSVRASKERRVEIIEIQAPGISDRDRERESVRESERK